LNNAGSSIGPVGPPFSLEDFEHKRWLAINVAGGVFVAAKAAARRAPPGAGRQRFLVVGQQKAGARETRRARASNGMGTEGCGRPARAWAWGWGIRRRRGIAVIQRRAPGPNAGRTRTPPNSPRADWVGATATPTKAASPDPTQIGALSSPTSGEAPSRTYINRREPHQNRRWTLGRDGLRAHAPDRLARNGHGDVGATKPGGF